MNRSPHERVAALLEWKGWTQAQAAEVFNCSAAFVSMIVRGVKLPGRLVANAIERESKDWPEGPIRATEWDRLELARRESAGPAEPLGATGTDDGV